MVAHDVLTYLSAIAADFPDINIKINKYNYSDIDTQEYNPNYKLEYREGQRPTVNCDDPMYDENPYYDDFIKYHRPVNNTVSSLEVLALYSVEPDWGMDLNLHLSPLQNLMGGSTGYRHMRYVLFYMLRAGLTKKQFYYFNSIAEEAFKRGDPYWGIRFSARAIHYLEDFLTPVHSKPFTEFFLIKNLFKPAVIYNKGFNYHMNFEKLTGYHIWHGEQTLIDAIKSSPVRNIKNIKNLLNTSQYKIRMLFYPIFKEMERLWGNKMAAPRYSIKIEEIKNNTRYKKIFELSARWLYYSSSIIKGYIKNILVPRFNKYILK